MRPNQAKIKCRDCDAIMVTARPIRYIKVCPECYSIKLTKVREIEKTNPVTSPAAVSQDIEYYPSAQRTIRATCKKFDVRLGSLGLSFNPYQRLEVGPAVKELRAHVQEFEKMLEGLGLPLEYQQKDQ